jgi:hypothetical protein
MQITVACHRCEHPKRPLTPCPVCTAAPLAEPELQAWRISLHAHHLARITRKPRPMPLPDAPVRPAMPMRMQIVLNELADEPATPTMDTDAITAIAVDPALPPADDAKSFDWEDEGGWRLRRSA